MHSTKSNERLVQVVSKLTGIPEKTIKKYGIQSVFQTPWTVKGMTNERKQRIEMLQDFISLWNEIEYVKEETFLSDMDKAGEFFRNRIGHKIDKEYFEVAYLTVHNQVIAIETIPGTLTQAAVYPREIIKSTLAYNADRIMLAHSHPANSLKASQADLNLTAKIITAAKAIDVTVIDHFIVTEDKYLSLRAYGFM